MPKKEEKPSLGEEIREAAERLNPFPRARERPGPPEPPPGPPSPAAPGPPPRVVEVTRVEPGGAQGATVLVWAKVGSQEVGVPFHRSDLESLAPEPRRQHVARQVLAALDMDKPPPAESPLAADLGLLGPIEV